MVHKALPASEFIGRMIQHLPPKGFRMVRYYGIYARPVRDKIHKMVALVLKELARTAEKVAQYFAQKLGISPEEYRRKLDERFGNRQIRCEKCGSTKMLLIRIWSKDAGIIYEIGQNDAPVRQFDGVFNAKKVAGPCMGMSNWHLRFNPHFPQYLIFVIFVPFCGYQKKG